MPELPKLPPQYVWATAMSYPVGAKVAFEPSAMVVDHEKHCWIDPFAKPARFTRQNDGELIPDRTVLMLERVEGGFKLDLTYVNPNPNARLLHPYMPGAKPEPKHGVEWIPVVEIIALPLPTS